VNDRLKSEPRPAPELDKLPVIRIGDVKYRLLALPEMAMRNAIPGHHRIRHLADVIDE